MLCADRLGAAFHLGGLVGTPCFSWQGGVVLQARGHVGVLRPLAFSQIAMHLDSGLSRKHEGTGLGLPLTKSLVEMHGGYLDLQSKVGVGTTVTVRFPAKRIVHLPRDVQTLGVAEGQAG